MRNPVILAKSCRLVELLLVHLHGKRAHCGYKSLIYESRERFWIVGVRHMAKHLTGKCVTCKKLRKKPLEQLMGQIPKLRVAAGFPAFSNTAIDMFGPLQVRLGRKTLKEAHVIIFTCMTTRAVHLELIKDRCTDMFLMAFWRFFFFWGNPKNRWSDCGTNFIGKKNNFRLLFSGFGMSVAPVIRTELWRVSLNQYDKRWMLRLKTKPSQKSRSYLLNKSASSLPKLKRNFGKSAYHAKWSFGRKSFSTSDARSRIESKSKTPHEKYRETSARVLELLDEIFCSQSAAKKQVVQKARKSTKRRFGVRNWTNSQENVEDGTCTRNLSRWRWSC